MSLTNWKNRVEKYLLSIVWAHWNKLGANVYDEKIHTNCDPEAILLLSCLLSKKDERLMEILGAWVHRYESVINIERLKSVLSLINEYSLRESVLSSLVNIILLAVPKGNQKRWNSILSLVVSIEGKVFFGQKNILSNSKKLKKHAEILKDNLLMNFRFLLGATAKADVLYYVIQNGFHVENEEINIALIARKLHYHPSSIHRIAYELSPVLRPLGELDKVTSLSVSRDSPLFLLPPKNDSFFIDWFRWVELVINYLTIEGDLEERHLSVAEHRIQHWLRLLLNFTKEETGVSDEVLLGRNLEKISLTETCEYSLIVLDDIMKCLLKPSALDWGGDSLTRFLEEIHQNSWSVYAETDSAMFQNYIELDRLMQVSLNFLNKSEKSINKNVYFLFHRCLSAFRAAVGLCSQGQSFEATAIIRLMLETALYAMHLFENPNDIEIFENRRTNPNKYLSAARKIFAPKTIIKNSLESKNFKYTALVQGLYDTTIDFGAHPNFEGLNAHSKLIEENKNLSIYDVEYATVNGPQAKRVRSDVLRAVILCLLIFQLIDGDSFAESQVSQSLEHWVKFLT